jgi:hypothetical protein
MKTLLYVLVSVLGLGLLFLLLVPSTSAIPGFIIIFSVVGAVVDYQYKRKGGKKSSRTDKVVFWSVAGGIALLILVLYVVGVNPGKLGGWSFDIAMLLFAGWEVRRWMTRQDQENNSNRKSSRTVMTEPIEERARVTGVNLYVETVVLADAFDDAFKESTGSNLPSHSRLNLLFEPFLFATSSIAFHLEKRGVDPVDCDLFTNKLARTLAYYLAELHAESEWKESNFALHEEKVKGQFLLILQERLHEYKRIRQKLRTRVLIALSGDAGADKQFLGTTLRHWMKESGTAPPDNLMNEFVFRVVAVTKDAQKGLVTAGGKIALTQTREMNIV